MRKDTPVAHLSRLAERECVAGNVSWVPMERKSQADRDQQNESIL